ncbi:DUF3084 domain-containing protein [Geminocystis sp. CENA526]|uniref:DUF3084 domain-containing protein n=1 Tax=Geminocystis sp. CENA526 TaxID=1355871 RepID=UPI003D6F3D9C
MTSAYILVIAILVLGGLIAALGDRIGSKIGKARLRLFQLRPKQTAIVITIGTGILISASTLLILFTFSSSLRQGVFELDEILKRRREITQQLETVEAEKERVERELSEAQKRQNSARELLTKTGKELSKTQTQLKSISSQSDKLKEEVGKIIAEKTVLLAEKEEIQQQREKLEISIAKRDQELKDNQLQIEEQREILETQQKVLEEQKLSLQELKNRQNQLELEIKGRDEQIATLDKSISEKDQILRNKEEELSFLERELGFYRREVEILEQYYQTYQDLRERPIAVVKGQVLTVTLVKTDKDTNLEELIDGILNEANRGVMLILGYGNQSPHQRFVQITKAQVEQMKQQLSPPGEYLVRIFSASNYVQGEENVRIFADVTPNQRVYAKNDTIASISIDPKDFQSTELQQKLDFLIAVTEFRARREGILGRIVIGDGKILSLINFLQQLQLSDETVDEIIAISANDTNTSGPLQVNLVVMSNGREILRL